MGLCFKITNATFKKHIGIADIEENPIIPDVPDEPAIPDVPNEPAIPDTYPVTDTLKGLYYLGGTVEESLVNQSGNGDKATLIGSITLEESYATFTGAMNVNRIDTDVATPIESGVTMVALFRVPTGRRAIVSTYKASNGGFVFSNDYAFVATSDGGTNKGTYTDTNESSNFVICAFSANTEGLRVVKDVSGAIAEIYTADCEPRAYAQNVTIGGGRSNITMGDNADIALVSIHDGELTDAQLQQIFAYVRKYGEDKGLVVD